MEDKLTARKEYNDAGSVVFALEIAGETLCSLAYQSEIEAAALFLGVSCDTVSAAIGAAWSQS